MLGGRDLRTERLSPCKMTFSNFVTSSFIIVTSLACERKARVLQALVAYLLGRPLPFDCSTGRWHSHAQRIVVWVILHLPADYHGDACSRSHTEHLLVRYPVLSAQRRYLVDCCLHTLGGNRRNVADPRCGNRLSA